MKTSFISAFVVSVLTPNAFAICSIGDGQQKQIAVVMKTVGSVARLSGDRSQLKVDQLEGLRCNETLKTGSGSQALLKFGGGGKILLYPESSLTVKSDSSPLANVAFGDLKIQLSGRLEFSADGKRSRIDSTEKGVRFSLGESFPSRTPAASPVKSTSKMVSLETQVDRPITVVLDRTESIEAELFDKDGNVIDKVQPMGRQFVFPARNAGQFIIQFSKTATSEAPRIRVRRIRMIVTAPSSIVVAGRGLASEPDNGSRSVSELEVEGSLWSVQSSLQKSAQKNQSNFGVLGGSFRLWRARDAFEAAFQTALLTAAPNSLTPTRFEGRYHRLFGRTSVFAGAELYTSRGDDNFRSSYAQGEIGLRHTFSFGELWALSPLVSGGWDFGDQFSGLVELKADRKLNSSSSIGAGARVHLYNQSEYREGRSEAFAYVKWSY